MSYSRCVSILIVADVHANLPAFDAAIAFAENAGPVEAIWCLGDLVGYAAEPGPCIERLRAYPHLMIAGNHDLAAAGVIGTEDFNPVAAEAAEWTARQLSATEKTFLRSLPLVLVEGTFTLVHGSLVDPVWDYLISDSAAVSHFERQTTPYCLVGHSHLPLLFGNDGRGALVPAGQGLALGAESFVANPGSIGQPRDGDPRAAFALLDLDARAMTFHRVPYDVEAAQSRIRAAALPDFLAERLGRGR